MPKDVSDIVHPNDRSNGVTILCIRLLTDLNVEFHPKDHT